MQQVMYSVTNHSVFGNLMRTIGIVYLAIIVLGLFSGIAVRGNLVDFSDSFNTVDKILANVGLYRLGFLCDLLMVICDVAIAVLFFFLFASVSLSVAIGATVFRLIQSAVLAANLLNLYNPLLLTAGYYDFDLDQQKVIATSVINSLQAFEYGYLTSGVFFSINCLLMGYLIKKSDFVPSFWGGALVVAGLAYLLNSVVGFIAPEQSEYTELIVVIFAVFGELGLCLFLITRGRSNISSLASTSSTR
jgi:hypothetical protein